MKNVVVVALRVDAMLFPSAAWSCAGCARGDPALTSMGTEPPLDAVAASVRTP